MDEKFCYNISWIECEAYDICLWIYYFQVSFSAVASLLAFAIFRHGNIIKFTFITYICDKYYILKYSMMDSILLDSNINEIIMWPINGPRDFEKVIGLFIWQSYMNIFTVVRFIIIDSLVY